MGVYLSNELLNARIIRDNGDNGDEGHDDDNDEGSDGGNQMVSNVPSDQGLAAQGQGLISEGQGLGFPPETILYEVLEYNNERIQAGITFFAAPGIYTLRAKFEPWEDIWRPFDVMGERGLQSTLNFLPATKLVKLKVIPAKPAPVLLQWAHPAPVTYGALLGSQQFDALLLPQAIISSPLHNPYNGTTNAPPSGSKTTANPLLLPINPPANTSSQAPANTPANTPIHHIYPANYQYFIPNPFFGQNYVPPVQQTTGTMSRTRANLKRALLWHKRVDKLKGKGSRRQSGLLVGEEGGEEPVTTTATAAAVGGGGGIGATDVDGGSLNGGSVKGGSVKGGSLNGGGSLKGGGSPPGGSLNGGSLGGGEDELDGIEDNTDGLTLSGLATAPWQVNEPWLLASTTIVDERGMFILPRGHGLTRPTI